MKLSEIQAWSPPEELESCRPTESYAAGVTGVFVFGWTGFFAETAFFAAAGSGTTRLGVALFTAGAEPVIRASFFAAFLAFAQRAFWAAAILARTSVLRVRRTEVFAGLALVAAPAKLRREGRSV